MTITFVKRHLQPTVLSVFNFMLHYSLLVFMKKNETPTTIFSIVLLIIISLSCWVKFEMASCKVRCSCFLLIVCFVNDYNKVCLVQHDAVLSCIFVFKTFSIDLTSI